MIVGKKPDRQEDRFSFLVAYMDYPWVFGWAGWREALFRKLVDVVNDELHAVAETVERKAFVMQKHADNKWLEILTEYGWEVIVHPFKKRDIDSLLMYTMAKDSRRRPTGTAIPAFAVISGDADPAIYARDLEERGRFVVYFIPNHGINRETFVGRRVKYLPEVCLKCDGSGKYNTIDDCWSCDGTGFYHPR